MDAAATTGAPGTDPMDRAPEPAPRRRPAGLLWASALAAVVLAVAVSVAIRNPGTATSAPTTLAGGAGSGTGSGAGAPGNPLLNQGPSLVGQAAPALALPELTLDADQPADTIIALADHRGTPVVLNFWASSCTPCRTEMPAFQRVHERLGDKVAFIGIDVADLDSQGRALARQTGVTYPLAVDRRGEAMATYGAAALPTTVVIDRDGIVRTMRSSEMSEAELDAALAPLVR